MREAGRGELGEVGEFGGVCVEIDGEVGNLEDERGD